jgi:YD repeat-containing protein
VSAVLWEMSRLLALAAVTIVVLVAAPAAMADGAPITTVAVPGGEAGRFAYDPFGRLVRADVGGRTTTYQYDDAGRLAVPGGNVVAYDYDPVGVVQYDYDEWHRLRRASGPGGTASLSYDRAGRLVAITGTDGGVTSFAYDSAGQLSYALPEVDDEVVVAFVPGEPNEPYVVGLLWQEDRPDGGRMAFSVSTRGRLLTCSACP